MPIKSITRFFAIAPLFLVPFFPIIMAQSYFFPFITGKAFCFRILIEVAFLAWVVLAFLDAKYRPKWNALTISVTAFTIIALVADLLGANPIRSIWSNFERMEGWITIAHLWMFFMVTVNILGVGSSTQSDGSSKKLWHNWMNVSVLAAFIVACYGLVQFFHSESRVDATLGNAAYMAVYMLLNAGFALYLLLESKARRGVIVAREKTEGVVARAIDTLRSIDLSALEWIYGVLTVIFAFLLIETATRGTMLGLVGGIIVALVIYAIFGKSTNRLSRQISGGIVALLLVLGVLFVVFRHSPVIQNYLPLQRLASISLSNTESVSRIYIWDMAFTGFVQRPILGWGQENFNYVFNANYNPKMWNQEQWFDRAHSVYIDWLINGGIIGLLSYLALYVFFLTSVWKSNLTIAEKSALIGLLVGYAVHNIFVFDNLASYVFFFALLGFAATLKKKESSDSQVPHQRVSREINIEIVEYVIAPVAIIALVFGIYFLNVRQIQQNTQLITALRACGNNPDAAAFEKVFASGVYVGSQEAREQLLSCTGQVINSQQVPNPTKQAFYVLVTNEIKNQIDATPKDARIYTLAGSFFEQIGAFGQAATYLEKAHLLSPTKQTTSMALATAYVNLNQSDKAVAILKQAYEEEISNTDARNAYMTALIVSGHESDAQRLFGNDQSLFNTEQVAQAYFLAKQYDKAIAIYQNIIGTSTEQINTQLRLAQTQYSAGYVSQAIATLRLVEKNHPEYTNQLDAAIKQVQTGK